MFSPLLPCALLVERPFLQWRKGRAQQRWDVLGVPVRVGRFLRGCGGGRGDQAPTSRGEPWGRGRNCASNTTRSDTVVPYWIRFVSLFRERLCCAVLGLPLKRAVGSLVGSRFPQPQLQRPQPHLGVFGFPPRHHQRENCRTMSSTRRFFWLNLSKLIFQPETFALLCAVLLRDATMSALVLSCTVFYCLVSSCLLAPPWDESVLCLQ